MFSLRCWFTAVIGVEVPASQVTKGRAILLVVRNAREGGGAVAEAVAVVGGMERHDPNSQLAITNYFLSRFGNIS